MMHSREKEEKELNQLVLKPLRDFWHELNFNFVQNLDKEMKQLKLANSYFFLISKLKNSNFTQQVFSFFTHKRRSLVLAWLLKNV